MMLNRRKILLLALSLFVLETVTSAAEKDWPAVLSIDDFENGVGKWHNDDAGALTVVDDGGNKVLKWTAADDGIGHIVLSQLNRETIDFSQYQLLTFRVRVSGKPVWNLNPIVQQYPAVYGFRGLYYSIDTMHPFERWFTYTQDLSRWENAWADSFNADKQEFQFEVHQLAGAAKTTIYLDDIRLLKNPLGIKPSYPGTWARLPDGSQVTHFELSLDNNSDVAVRVALELPADDPGDLNHMQVELPTKPLRLLPGEQRKVTVAMTANAALVKSQRPYYGETARIGVHVLDTAGLVLFTELTAGTVPETVTHPCVMTTPKQRDAIRRQYADPKARAEMNPRFRQIVASGEKALAHVPEYPPSAAPGLTKDPVSKEKLVKVDVPNLPFNVYQDPTSGRSYSGPLYDAGMLGWARKHTNNAQSAKDLALAYLVTGKKVYATAAAAIVRKYIAVYPQLPLVPYQGASCSVGSACSGVVRINGSYMHERRWLTNLAIAVDSIRSAGVLSDDDLAAIAQDIFVPSAMNMMDHKVGAMNLQWMIQSSALFAGLAVDNAMLVSRALNDRHGIRRLLEQGFLQDGHWWENPSYQGVAKLAAFPALQACFYNGLMSWSKQCDDILKAPYKLHGPDGLSPTLGTGGYRNLKLADAGIHLFAEFITDPELAWVHHHRKLVPNSYGVVDHAVFRQAPSRVAKDKTKSPIPDQSVHFPDYGGVAMRVPGSDRYCYVHYGRELVHGHRNKLSFNAYGAGAWFARNVMGGYGHNFKNFLETIASANTIMVDGKNADADTGELLFLKSIPGAEMLSAREVGAYKDVEHERTLVLTAGPMVVLDRCMSAASHNYDWLYHAAYTDLQLPRDGFADRVASLGDSVLYSGFESLAERPGPAHLTLDRKAGKRSKGGGLQVVLADGGTVIAAHVSKKSAQKPHDAIIWRQSASNVGFAAVLRPYEDKKDDKLVVERLVVNDDTGKAVDITHGQAVKVTSSEGILVVLVNYGTKTLTADGLSSTGRVTVRMSEGYASTEGGK